MMGLPKLDCDITKCFKNEIFGFSLSTLMLEHIEFSGAILIDQ